MGNGFLLIFAGFFYYFKNMSVSSQLMQHLGSTFSLLSFYFSFLEF